MTCIGNSGPLPEPVSDAIEKGNLLSVHSLQLLVLSLLSSMSVYQYSIQRFLSNYMFEVTSGPLHARDS